MTEALITLLKLFLLNCFSLFQSEKDQAEMKELRAAVEQQSKTIKRFNRGESEHRLTASWDVTSVSHMSIYNINVHPYYYIWFCPSVVSMMAAQEYEGMKEQLDLEQNLRVKAESYAHEVKEQSQKYGADKVQVTHVNTGDCGSVARAAREGENVSLQLVYGE